MFGECCLDICLIGNPFSCSLSTNLIEERSLEAYSYGLSFQVFFGRYLEIFFEFFEILYGFSHTRIYKIKDFLFFRIEYGGWLSHREKY